MLLDPFEEQLNLPSLAINRCHVVGRNLKVIRQEDESFINVGGVKADAAKPCREFPEAVLTGQNNGLIATNSIGAINRVRTAAAKLEIAFAAENKVSRRLMQAV